MRDNTKETKDGDLMKREHKAIALFSGGLDSILSVLHMQNLGYEVVPIFFESPFYSASKARQGAKIAGLNVKVVDVTPELVEVLKNPRYGFGKSMNPCVDCHGMMFRKAAELLEKYNADFIISGEVIGQRPMSQRRDSMNSVAKLSGVKDLIVRPLCQKLLADTKPITEGWVDKKEMLDFNGRSRQPQIAMAKELGIKDFENPGGGCLLTEKQVGEKVTDLLKYDQLTPKYLKFLQQGRRVRISENLLLIVTRTKYDNDYITPRLTDEIVIKATKMAGPLGVLLGENITEEQIKLAGRVILSYINKLTEPTAEVEYGKKFELENKLELAPLPREELETMLINI
ncbi:MAG: tRNA (5-methylaminomethyl-2-thiouridylate)-methyltransferase [Candidatus Cloacimonadales bacterium]